MLPRRAIAASALSLGLLAASACGTETVATDASAPDSSGSPDTSASPSASTSTKAKSANGKAASRNDASSTPAVYDFTSETVAGEAFDGADLAGTPTVLWFWAPWCPTCRAQIAGVGALAEAHGDAVDVIGVGSLDDTEAIDAFAADVSSEVTMLDDADGAVWRHFGVTAQSTYLVVDVDGEAVASGSLSDDELASTVDDLVG